MSMMGELNYFLGLQLKKLKHGTFLSQSKYYKELLKQFEMERGAKRLQHQCQLVVIWMLMRRVWL